MTKRITKMFEDDINKKIRTIQSRIIKKRNLLVFQLSTQRKYFKKEVISTEL